MIATRCASTVSVLAKARPLTMGIPSVSKYRGVAIPQLAHSFVADSSPSSSCVRALQSASYFANVMGPEHTNVEVTDEFRAWWDGLDIRDQRAVAKVVDALVRRGPRLHMRDSKSRTSFALGGTVSTSVTSERLLDAWFARQFPYSSGIKGSRHRHMRELRVPSPDPRVLLDRHRTAILLIAGHKADSERFYRDYTPRADAIYDEYLREIEQERQRTITRGGPER